MVADSSVVVAVEARAIIRAIARAEAIMAKAVVIMAKVAVATAEAAGQSLALALPMIGKSCRRG